MKKAFTLAEVMITLTIIGIISAIVVPVAINSRPDENVMKFKKAHNTLYQVINTLVTSDKYYLDGDLGVTADGRFVNVTYKTQDYLCNTIIDILSTKKTNCIKYGSGRKSDTAYILASNELIQNIATGEPMVRAVNASTIQATKESMDNYCKIAGKKIGAEIITTDNITFYQSSIAQFGSKDIQPNEINGNTEVVSLRHSSPPNQSPANYSDEQGFDIAYKIFCIDIDGIPDNVTTTDCVNECPFGYGVRADGKIMTGKRADEWLEKDIQGEN